jgi:hypothetical protein
MVRLIAILLVLVGLPAAAQEATRLNPRQALTTPVEPQVLQIYVATNGQTIGPLDAAGFIGILGTPEAAASTHVWMPGMTDWALASTVPALQAIIASMGQNSGGGMAPPADPASFMLGVWISDDFQWKIQDVPYSAIVQMKLLPDGRTEGATLFRAESDLAGPIFVSHEAGTYTVAALGNGKFEFARIVVASNVADGQVVGGKQPVSDSFVFTATGPNSIVSDENIAFVRVPEGP